MAGHIPVPNEVIAVFFELRAFEDLHNLQPALFSELYSEGDDKAHLISGIARALKVNGVPDIELDPKGWVLFIMNETLEFIQDFSVPDIKTIITNEDRESIADLAVIRINGIRPFASHQDWDSILENFNEMLNNAV